MKHILSLILSFQLILIFPIIGISQQTSKENNPKTPIQNLKKNAALFVEANKAKNDGNTNKAELLFKECIRLDPRDAASMYELSRIYILNNKLEEAKNIAENAVELDTANSWYKLLLSSIYKLSKNYGKSVEVLESVVKQNPTNLEFIEELAYNYILIGEDEKAIQALNVIENKIGISEELAIQKQTLFTNLNKIDSAIYEIEKLINEFPTEVRYYSLLAELCLQNNLKEKAFWAYSKIAEIEPGNAYIHISLSDFYRKSGDSTKAFEELKLGFENDQLDIDSKIQILLSYFTAEQIINQKNEKAFELISILADKYPENVRILSIKSEVLYQTREFEKAKELLLKVIAIDSSLFGSWEQLLITESGLSDFKSLEKHSLTVMKLFPDRPISYLFAGMVNSQNKKFEEALNYYKKGIKLVRNNIPLSVQFYSFLGDTYHELKNDKESDESYEIALKLDPVNSIILNNYAYYLALRSEKLEQAKQMSFKAVELDPGNASNLDTKAWVLYKLNMFEEAKQVIEKAMNFDEEISAEVFEHYGDILFQLGEKKKAVKFWKMARKKGPESERLNQKIKGKKLNE